jgi:hypothetical protein
LISWLIFSPTYGVWNCLGEQRIPASAVETVAAKFEEATI